MKNNLPASASESRFAMAPSISALRRQFDRLFDDFGAGAAFADWNGNGRLLPEADYAETDKEIVITADLPGVDQKDVEITLEDDLLTIRGEKRVERDEKKERYQLCERSYGAFERSMSVPHGIDADKIKATFDKGVLKVTMPKPAELQTLRKQIKISA